MYNDLNLKISSIDELIKKLESDNRQIEVIVKDINEKIDILNDTNWKSSEKVKLDNILKPYIISLNDNVYNYLEDCVITLKKAISSYDNYNKKFVNDSSSLV